MTIYRTGVCTYIIPTIRYMWFTNVYKIYKQHTNYLIASNMTSYSTSIQNQQTDRQGNSIHDVLGMPCSGRRLQFCSGFHMTLMTRCHYICKMFPIVTPSFTPYRTFHALEKTLGEKPGWSDFIHCRGWFTTRNSEDKKLLAPQMSDHYLKQKEQLTK